jgi:hypothetical protein
MRFGRNALVAIILCFAATAQASAPTCSTSGGQGYCQYSGPISAAYVNSSGQILVYFDTPLDLSLPASVGIGGVTIGAACIYPIASNPDYAKMLYASVLAAQARGATVTMQLWGANSGYLICDRIWAY